MIKDGKKTGKTKKVDNENASEEIAQYIKSNVDVILETTVLVFIGEDINENELSDVIKGKGISCNFEKLKPHDIIRRLKGIVSAYEVSVDENTLQYLIEISGTSMQVLINEIRKLIEYVGKNGTIKKDDVDKLAIREIESVIFDLTDSLGQKQTKKALNILDELIYNKEPIQRILITLYNHFRKLYLVKLSRGV